MLRSAGYYSRYAALRSLLMQFLALGLGGGGTASPAQQPPAQQPPAPGPQPSQQAEQPAGQQPAPPATLQQEQQQPGLQQQAAPMQAPKRQVVVLGAGYDTTYFQLASEGIYADKYIELDFRQARPLRLPLPSCGIARAPASWQSGWLPQHASGWGGWGAAVACSCGVGWSLCMAPHGLCVDTRVYMCNAEEKRLKCVLPCLRLCCLQVAQKKAAAIQQLPELLACIGGPAAAASISPGRGRAV